MILFSMKEKIEEHNIIAPISDQHLCINKCQKWSSIHRVYDKVDKDTKIKISRINKHLFNKS